MKAHDNDDARHTSEKRLRSSSLHEPAFGHTDNHSNGNSTGHDESAALLKGQGQGRTHVYLRRWYVLFVFSMCSVVQGLAYGTYGPIAQSLKAAFGWTKETISLLCLWNSLAFVLAAWPISKVIELKGLRYGTVVSIVLATLGLALRCISSDPLAALWLNSISQLLSGASAVLPMGAVALLSSLWFPHTQRTTATAIATFTSFIGIALSFIIGPLLVPEPHSSGSNSSNLSVDSQANTSDGSSEREAIMMYFYYNAGFSALILLVVLIYFPSKPPLPPSISAEVKRLDQREGLRSLLKNKPFQLILLIYSVMTGVYLGFSQVLDINLEPLGVTQTMAGWMGFYANIGGVVSGFLVSRTSDVFPRRHKLFLILMFLPITAILVWFLLLEENYISPNTPSLYISVVLPGCLVYGSYPVFFELACEIGYPVGEDMSTFLLTTGQNLANTIFLSMLIIPGSSVSWINWLLICVAGAVLLLLMLVREDYHRMKVDDTGAVSTASSPGADHQHSR